jgi:glyoxylate reductase
MLTDWCFRTAPSAHKAWDTIAEIAEVVRPQAKNREEFLVESRAGAFDGCAVAYRTFDSIGITGKIDGELVQALPDSLRFICHNGAGYDQVEVPACTARGIRVSNTPTAVDDATADIGIFLMIGALRNLSVSMSNLRNGTWRGSPPPALGHDPQGKVMGILGMGGIGRNMAKKALAFGVRIRYYNRTRLDEALEKEIEAEYVDFETLLRESDVLSLNLPLNVSLFSFLPFSLVSLLSLSCLSLASLLYSTHSPSNNANLETMTTIPQNRPRRDTSSRPPSLPR